MISFRKISKDDLPLILGWRTDPEVIRYMSTDIEFNLEKQTNWSIRPGLGLPPKYLDKVLQSKARHNIERGTPVTFDLIE